MFFGLIKYHLLVLLREPLNVFFGFGFPLLNLFMQFGPLRDNENVIMGDVMANAMPIFITIAAMVLCFTDSAMSHAYTRQIKFLRRLRMTPVEPVHYITTGILSRIGVLLLFAATFIIIGATMFELEIPAINTTIWPIFLGVLILSFIMLYLVGMFFANLLKNAKTAQNSLFVVFFGLLLLGGFWFPLGGLPEFVQTISDWIPPSLVVNSLQAAWQGTDLFAGHHFFALLGSIVVFGLLSLKFFKYE